MKTPGEPSVDLLVRARSVLLDPLEALREHHDSVIVIGAQAVYLRTGGLDVALAESTKDSDVVIDPRGLEPDPRLEAAMKAAGFLPNQGPGAWLSADGIPVDIMVPEALAGKGRRSAEIPPHDKNAVRRAVGLEAALVDNSTMRVSSLDPSDSRTVTAKVAGPSALLVAKLHKIAERVNKPDRLNDKDAHDSYRILRAVGTAELAASINNLLADDLTREVTRKALDHLEELFASSSDALGSVMAGRAEEGVGEPEQVSVAVSLLAEDLLEALGKR